MEKIRMKFLFNFSIFSFSVMLIGSSCKKQTIDQKYNCSAVPRQIQFSLYTEKDFSGNNENIVFTLSIRTSTSRVLWDSVLAPMKVKDIPGVANKLVIEKLVTVDDCSLLKVGFIYAIENVGISWFWDKSNAGENFKKVEFNFQ